MTAVTYLAKRNLAGGHSVDTSYDLETECSVLNPSDVADIKQSFTLDGTPETVFNNLSERWSVTTIVDQSDYNLWREFWSSVAGGESFTFDAYGSIATPDNPITVVMVGGATPKRVGTVDSWQFSFKVRAI